MKNLYAGLALLTLVVLSGCNKGTAGGPGATAESPGFGQAENTFNLKTPALSGALRQGTQVEGSIGIQRAKNFDQDVALKFGEFPKGVTIEPAAPVIKHGDSEAKITIKTGSDAPLGDFNVNVIGHPTKGADAEISFNLSVRGQDDFSLSVPRLSTSIKQGESKVVSIGIDRVKNFDQEVALSFGDLPRGVTLAESVGDEGRRLGSKSHARSDGRCGAGELCYPSHRPARQRRRCDECARTHRCQRVTNDLVRNTGAGRVR